MGLSSDVIDRGRLADPKIFSYPPPLNMNKGRSFDRSNSTLFGGLYLQTQANGFFHMWEWRTSLSFPDGSTKASCKRAYTCLRDDPLRIRLPAGGGKPAYSHL